MITATGDSTIRFFDALNTGHALAHEIKTPHRTGIHHLSASPDADLVAAVGFDGSISLWSLLDGKEHSVISSRTEFPIAS